MLQNYIKGKTIDDVLPSLCELEIYDFYMMLDRYRLRSTIPADIMREKEIELTTVKINKATLEEKHFLCHTYNMMNLYPSKKEVISKIKEYTDMNDKIKLGIIYNLFDYIPRDKNGRIVYNGSLNLRNLYLTKLPDNLTITGTLNCDYNNMEELPSGLIVAGLGCDYNSLTTLPPDLIVNAGNLYCRYQQTKIKLKLPKTAIVKGIFKN